MNADVKDGDLVPICEECRQPVEKLEKDEAAPVGLKALPCGHHQKWSDVMMPHRESELSAEVERLKKLLPPGGDRAGGGVGEGSWAVFAEKAVGERDVAQAELTIARRLLWFRHGCGPGCLYGDDGEMQCNRCLIDFKRDSFQKIEERLRDIGLQKLQQASTRWELAQRARQLLELRILELGRSLPGDKGRTPQSVLASVGDVQVSADLLRQVLEMLGEEL